MGWRELALTDSNGYLVTQRADDFGLNLGATMLIIDEHREVSGGRWQAHDPGFYRLLQPAGHHRGTGGMTGCHVGGATIITPQTPLYSPDRSEISYAQETWTSTAASEQIVVMSADGQSPRTVATSSMNDLIPGPESPHGRIADPTSWRRRTTLPAVARFRSRRAGFGDPER